MLEPSEELVSILREYGFEVRVSEGKEPIAGKIIRGIGAGIALWIWPGAPLPDGRWLKRLLVRMRARREGESIVCMEGYLDPKSPSLELVIGPCRISIEEKREEPAPDCLYQNIRQLLDELENPVHYVLGRVTKVFKLVDELLPRE